MGRQFHYGKSKGVNVETLNNYKKVLDSNEVDIIKICRRVKRRNTLKVVILRFNKNKREFI